MYRTATLDEVEKVVKVYLFKKTLGRVRSNFHGRAHSCVVYIVAAIHETIIVLLLCTRHREGARNMMVNEHRAGSCLPGSSNGTS